MHTKLRWATHALLLLGAAFVGPTAALAETASSESSIEEPADECAVKYSRSGRWHLAETRNFQACSLESQEAATMVARNAERLQTRLQKKWLGDDANFAWTAKCQIVVHSTFSSYVAACGRGSEHTVGSSLVKTDERGICGRRIDLLGARADYLTAALPHELTHVVLKDLFPAGSVPRWADEGAAILADTDSKQGRHRYDLERALAERTTYTAAALLLVENYPQPDRVGTFYGQSVSLAEFLIRRKDAVQFVAFVKRATTSGYDLALRECYEIADVGELDRQWQHSVRTSQAANSNSPAAAGKIAAQ